MTSRRQFIQIVPAAGAALLVARTVSAQSDMVTEKDPEAVRLGYVSDANKADKAKFKNWAAGEHCANCGLFQGKPTDAAGPCPLYPGKKVSAKGWCSAYVKKA
ncbi:MAG: high-potential iron-sulfur protein [Burkholderiales bacterium]|nr:high-potential iron-sulfur protein [Burkholderiales bacterium]